MDGRRPEEGPGADRRITIQLLERARDIEEWSLGRAPSEVIKQNSGRTVWRVRAGSPALFVKLFPRSFWRDRAGREASMLQALRQAGLPCPKLVATAKDRSGTYVLTEEIPAAGTLKSALLAGGADRRHLVKGFAELVRRLHDAGFEHGDLHSENVLVAADGMYILDVHRARRWAKVSARRRLEGAVMAAVSVSGLVTLADVFRFFRAYGLDRGARREAWERLRRMRHRYYVNRQKRCFQEGSTFGVQGGVYYRKGRPLDELLEAAWAPNGVTVQRNKRESLERIGSEFFLKRTSASRARRFWRNAQGLAVRGIETPRLWACGGSWVLGEWIQALDLYGHVRQVMGGMSRAERNDFLFRLARFVRKMHDCGVFHRDLKATNVLVKEGRFLPVDLDRVTFSLDVPERNRIKNLAQLNASLTPPLTRSDRLRFLDDYMGHTRALWERRRELVTAIMHLTTARRHRWPPRPENAEAVW